MYSRPGRLPNSSNPARSIAFAERRKLYHIQGRCNDWRQHAAISTDSWAGIHGVFCTVFEQLVRYLVADDDNLPCFIPSDVFRIQGNSVPFDWAAANYKLKNGNLFLLGYSPLSDNYAELTSLLRQTPDAVEHFLDYWHSEWHEYIE